MKIFRDPIHNVIDLSTGDASLDTLILALIDSQPFQRLRFIRQLGFAYLAYPSATHSRFEHSLGVAFLAKRWVGKLLSLPAPNPQDAALIQAFLQTLRDQQHVFLLAALLHDLGHGPLSHVTEDALGGHHETWTCAIILGNTEVNALLHAFDPSLPLAICHLLGYQLPDTLEEATSPTLPTGASTASFAPSAPSPFTPLITGAIDIDKIDYLLRDSHMTGSGYGKFDMEWLLNVLTLGVIDGEVKIGLDLGKGQSVAEDFIMARVYMFKNVYLHKINHMTNHMLTQLAQHLKTLPTSDALALFPNPALASLFLGKPSLEAYLSINDVTLFYFLHTLVTHPDPTLQGLSHGLLTRKLIPAPPTNRDTKSIPTQAGDLYLFDKKGGGVRLHEVSMIGL